VNTLNISRRRPWRHLQVAGDVTCRCRCVTTDVRARTETREILGGEAQGDQAAQSCGDSTGGITERAVLQTDVTHRHTSLSNQIWAVVSLWRSRVPFISPKPNPFLFSFSLSVCVSVSLSVCLSVCSFLFLRTFASETKRMNEWMHQSTGGTNNIPAKIRWLQTWKTSNTQGFFWTWKALGILREFCATSGKKCKKNKVFLVRHSNICVKQLLTG